MTISASEGIGDVNSLSRRSVPLQSVLDMESRDKILRLPVSGIEYDLVRLVDCWPGSLETYGLQISTGPVVPFRATDLIDETGKVPDNHVPLLWMNHVKSMRVTWPLGGRKPEYIKQVKAARPLLVPNRNYVLLRRFSAKEEVRRLVAGPYLAEANSVSMLDLENHLNSIYRPGNSLTEEETFGLAALFSSSLLDKYFRTSSGNTQVSATELRAMPLPAHETIIEIGRQAKALDDNTEEIDQLEIDQLVMRLAGTDHSRKKARARG